MKTQLVLCVLISQISFGSHYCDDRLANSSPATIKLYDQYKQSFSAFFCIAALAQNRNDIANRCGIYGLGNDWRSKVRSVRLPFSDESLITVAQGEVLHHVAKDMVQQLPDIADWLKKNAK